MSRKKKKKKNGRRNYHSGYDYHHILFQRKHWQTGYAKLLREHPYLGMYIPQRTLHRSIHSKIHDVPTPNGTDCRRAYNELIKREREGDIDIVFDTAEQRICFLIEMWRESCPATVAILKWQKEIIAKFYTKRTV